MVRGHGHRGSWAEVMVGGQGQGLLCKCNHMKAAGFSF